MYTEHNVRQTIAILVTTALLLIAMAPTLAHAATYLHIQYQHVGPRCLRCSHLLRQQRQTEIGEGMD